jgi:hypothetical protein
MRGKVCGTPEQRERFRAAYPTAPIEELLAIIPDVTPDQIRRIGNKMGLHRLKRHSKMNHALRALVRERAVKGVAIRDVKEYRRSQVRNICAKLRASGELFLGFVNQNASMYFSTQEAADEYVASYVPPVSQKMRFASEFRNKVDKPRRQIVIAKPKYRPGWGPNDPSHNPNNVKVQKCPSFTQTRPWSNTHPPY